MTVPWPAVGLFVAGGLVTLLGLVGVEFLGPPLLVAVVLTVVFLSVAVVGYRVGETGSQSGS